MKRLLSTLFCTARLAVGLIAKADTSSPVGLWETIDDATKKPKSHVRIFEQNGMLYGKIETLINPSEPNPVCKECKGDLKDKPITGMVIMNNMKAEDGGWEGGKITLDLGSHGQGQRVAGREPSEDGRATASAGPRTRDDR